MGGMMWACASNTCLSVEFGAYYTRGRLSERAFSGPHTHLANRRVFGISAPETVFNFVLTPTWITTSHLSQAVQQLAPRSLCSTLASVALLNTCLRITHTHLLRHTPADAAVTTTIIMSLVTVLGSMGTGGRVPGKGNVYGFGGIPPSLKEKKLKEAKLQNAVAKATVSTTDANTEPKKKEESK
ncbi:uncharacterized protein [Panulirus ornatus]|uniref:uncharacterized protein n=1 Tax=Panulirus ornatus TaxID=150431 RepID=UPI003A8AD6C1